MKAILILLFVCAAIAAPAQQLFVSSVPGKPIVRKAPLPNPDRGFHSESNYVITAREGVMFNPYGSGMGQLLTKGEPVEYYPDGFVAQRLQDAGATGDSISLTQLYVYLADFRDVDNLPEAALQNIQTLFDGLRRAHTKAVLRFAYRNEHTPNGKVEDCVVDGRYTCDDPGSLSSFGGPNAGYPSADRVIEHIKQLAPIIAHNMDAIAVVQSGFIGQWGEWTPGYGNDNALIMKELLQGIPEGYCMEVRYPDRKSTAFCSVVGEDNCARIGFNNDYFTGGQHPMACGGSDFGPCANYPDVYDRVAKESFNTYMVAEMPHGTDIDKSWGMDFFLNVDILMKPFKDHHYSAFDVIHNNKCNIAHWRTVPVYPARLNRAGLLYNPRYFEEKNGEIVPRSFYDFVRDHLGYRLNLDVAAFSISAEGILSYDIVISNTGFATVVNPRRAYLVLLDEATNRVACTQLLSDVNPKDWQPWDESAPTVAMQHHIGGWFAPENLPAGTYKVALWLPDSQDNVKFNPQYAIRLANDNHNVEWRLDAEGKCGLNVIGEVKR